MNAICWAIQNGNWSSASTWANGVIPDTSGTDIVYTNSYTINVDVNINVARVTSLASTQVVSLATPQMTGNSTPSGIVSASTVNVGSQAFNVFDRAIGTVWQTSVVNTGWIQYQYTSAKVIKRYAIIGPTTARLPKTWTFEGSNDGSSWTVLDTQSITLSSNQWYSFGISNSTAYLYYRLNISAVNTFGNIIEVGEFQMTESTESVINSSAGGTLNFNTSGVIATIGAASPGAANLISVTATTGTVRANLSSSLYSVASPAVNHSGNCDFILNGQNFFAGSTGIVCISKSSSGTITIYGNLLSTVAQASNCFTSNNGNTIVYGNVIAYNGNGITQSSGNVTVVGNVVGGTAFSSVFGISLTGASSILTVTGNIIGGSSTTNYGINFTGASGTITGNITGGTFGSAHGISTSALLTVNGNVYGNTAYGVSSSSNVTINGNVYASPIANGIAASATVYLKGNMYDVLGRTAIYCPNIFIDNTAVSLWEMSVGGGLTKKLYSADATPNLPVVGNVRDGITYGPASSLTGTMKIPSPSNVRTGVPTDNTVGSATALEAQDIINYISSSSDDLAKRLRRILTTEEAGNLIKNN